ncbi:MAG: restriction endonuclease subunit S [Akkermansia sp.]|nr:restriction endonuclease subunit S [Akkermansia sp.]
MNKWIKLKYVATSFSTAQKQSDVLENGEYKVYGASGLVGYLDTFGADTPYIGIVKDGAGVGRTNIYNAYTSLLGTMAYIVPRNPDNTNLHFLQYAISALNLGETAGDKATIPHIYFSVYGNKYILHVPVDTQKKIATYLNQKCDKVNSLIQNVQTQIEKLKAYRQSLITEVVTKGLDPTVPMKDSGVDWIGEIPEHWSVAALKYFTDILPGYAFSSNDFHAEAGIPLLRGVNVTPNGIRWDDTVYWNKEITDKLKPFILQLDDIVVGLDRPWISEGTRITRMTEKDLPSLLLQRVCRIRVKASMDSRWVFLGIASNAFKESLSTETTGISVPHISTKQIGDFIVALPSMETQKEICDFIDKKRSQIDRLITSKQAKIEKLEQYKRSLIYEYVTGKKEVRL